MGGHHHPSHFFFPDGDAYAELELLGRNCPSFPSSSSCCCCSCHRRCPSFRSPSSELEFEDHTDGGTVIKGDDGGDGAPSGGEHSEIAEGPGGGGRGEACDDVKPNRGSSPILLEEESSILVDGERRSPSTCAEEEISRCRRRRTYLELLRSHHDGGSARLALLEEAKDAITRYTPGTWISRVDGATLSKYRVPSTTTLLLVGPRGSGKSALVNRISRFLEDNPLLPDRAQVFHNISMAEGTYFLCEYMIPRDSKSFCLYDSRGLSEVTSDNFHVLKKWMNEGVVHGEMVLRGSDSSTVKTKIKAKVRDMQCSLSVKKRVNFVIFVVDGVSVLKTINSSNKHYTDMLFETFNYSFMSFKDNKPVLVVTHGDLLTFHERALVSTHLGELLGIPATIQIFDIPDLNCRMTKMAIVDLLRYSLEQADRNLPVTSQYVLESTKLPQWMLEQFHDLEMWILISEVVIIFICALIFLTQTLGTLVK